MPSLRNEGMHVTAYTTDSGASLRHVADSGESRVCFLGCYYTGRCCTDHPQSGWSQLLLDTFRKKFLDWLSNLLWA